MLGIGAMLHVLGGGSEHSAEKYYGMVITAAEFSAEDTSFLKLTFSEDLSIWIWDDGQSCCESRWLTTDDDVSSLVGNVLQRIEVREGLTAEADYDYHETMFVEVATSGGFITLCSHNQHNGYYGGICLGITEYDPRNGRRY